MPAPTVALPPLVQKIRQMATSYARGADVDDLAQDLHVKALELRSTHPDAPPLYLLKCLWNHARRWRGAEAKASQNVVYWEDFDLTAHPDDLLKCLERRSCLRRLEGALSRTQIQILELWAGDMREVQILDTLKVSKRTWQKRVRNAKQAAAEALENTI